MKTIKQIEEDHKKLLAETEDDYKNVIMVKEEENEELEELLREEKKEFYNYRTRERSYKTYLFFNLLYFIDKEEYNESNKNRGSFEIKGEDIFFELGRLIGKG